MHQDSPIPMVGQADLENLPARMDRRTAAAVISRHFFPISHRTLETWPVRWRVVNGKALAETAEILTFAAQKLNGATSIRG